MGLVVFLALWFLCAVLSTTLTVWADYGLSKQKCPIHLAGIIFVLSLILGPLGLIIGPAAAVIASMTE